MLSYAGIKAASASVEEGPAGFVVTWKWKNQALCTVTQVAAARLKEFDVKQDVYYAAIQWEHWLKAMAAAKVKYKEVAKFPAVQRDLAIVLDAATTYRQVQDATDQLKLDALQGYGLFDIFESEKLGAGKKSYALNYTFQLQDRTLTDVETDQLMKQLMDAYRNKLSAQIRE